ncbi:MAG: DUF4174 domain-containing protein [Deltaproteobacteria bacterium]|nr:DUF4174 domain-containing protein [Deltaproteobacteria bacterium]
MKRKMIFILLFYFWGQGMIHDAFGQGGGLMDLNAYRWRNRLLMVFSPAQDEPNYQSFIKEVQVQRNGLRDRDVLVLEILEKGESRLGKSPLKKDSAVFLREQFGIPPGYFCILLIGKDGEEKRRWESMGGLGVIFSVVDAMPMRQRELKVKSTF